MRVNIYAEEMTERVEIICKEVDGQQFTGLRIYLYLPVTHPVKLSQAGASLVDESQEYRGPFLHRAGDDDSSAVTFWGKRDLRDVLRLALAKLDEHYQERDEARKHA